MIYTVSLYLYKTNINLFKKAHLNAYQSALQRNRNKIIKIQNILKNENWDILTVNQSTTTGVRIIENI